MYMQEEKNVAFFDSFLHFLASILRSPPVPLFTIISVPRLLTCISEEAHLCSSSPSIFAQRIDLANSAQRRQSGGIGGNRRTELRLPIKHSHLPFLDDGTCSMVNAMAWDQFVIPPLPSCCGSTRHRLEDGCFSLGVSAKRSSNLPQSGRFECAQGQVARLSTQIFLIARSSAWSPCQT